MVPSVAFPCLQLLESQLMLPLDLTLLRFQYAGYVLWGDLVKKLRRDWAGLEANAYADARRYGELGYRFARRCSPASTSRRLANLLTHRLKASLPRPPGD